MGRPRSLALCGLDRTEESAFGELLTAAVRHCGIPWQLSSEADADALLIDVDSMYGQMSWLRAQGGSRPIIALTSATRADADFRLPRPVDAEALGEVLSTLSERIAVPVSTPVEAAPAPAAPSATPAKSAPAAEPKPAAQLEQPAQPAPAPAIQRDPQLLDYLRDDLLPGAVKLRDTQPPLVVDPVAKTFLGSSSLKPLLPVARREVIADEEWEAITPHEFERLGQELGGVQPLSRLIWLAGLGAGNGELRWELAEASRFKLGKYPTTEREFPKHIRIATAMLKQLSTPDELAAASGMERADVCDFINACFALGLVETDAPAAATAESNEPAKGGLLGRLRGKR